MFKVSVKEGTSPSGTRRPRLGVGQIAGSLGLRQVSSVSGPGFSHL